MGFSAQARADQLVHSYINEHGLAALTLRAGEDGAPIITATAAFDWKWPHDAVWWHADINRLRDVAEAAARAADVDDAARILQLTAERAGLRLTPHATMLERARGAVTLVEKRLRDMQAKGDMRSINIEYQDFRLRMKETGRNAPPFWSWMHEKKLAMVKAVAATASGRRLRSVAT